MILLYQFNLRSRRSADPCDLSNSPNVHSSHTSNTASAHSYLWSCQVDHLEVPFIWTYRKDYLHKAMKRKHLWDVVQLDERWEDHQGRREKLLQELEGIKLAANVPDGGAAEVTTRVHRP